MSLELFNTLTSGLSIQCILPDISSIDSTNYFYVGGNYYWAVLSDNNKI